MILPHVRRLWRAEPPPGWMFGHLPESVYHFVRGRLFLILMTITGGTILALGMTLLFTEPGTLYDKIVSTVMAVLLIPMTVFAGKCATSSIRLRKHLSGNHPSRCVTWGIPRQYRASSEHLQQQRGENP